MIRPFPHGVRAFVRLAVYAMVLAGLDGCQGMNGMASTSQLRVIDATPDAGALDIYAADGAVAYNLQFGTMTSYVPVSRMTRSLSTEVAGTRTSLAATKASLSAAKQYTLVVSNVAGALQTSVLLDQSTPTVGGQSAVRFLNEATSPGGTDLYLLRKGGRMVDAIPMAKRTEFGTNTGYVTVPPGVYSVVAVTAGETLKSGTIARYLGPSANYGVGSARTVVLVERGGVDGPVMQTLVASDYDASSGIE